MVVTKNGTKKMKKRMGINSKSSERQSELALENGLHPNEIKGKLQKWVNFTVMSYKYKRYIVIYNGMAFVYESTQMKLLTVLTLPPHVRKEAINQLRKKKERGIENERR